LILFKKLRNINKSIGSKLSPNILSVFGMNLILLANYYYKYEFRAVLISLQEQQKLSLLEGLEVVRSYKLSDRLSWGHHIIDSGFQSIIKLQVIN